MDLKKIFDDELNKPRPIDPNYKPSTIKSFKPSTLSSPCLRKIYYSYNKVEEVSSFDAKFKRIMRLGDAFHDILKDTLRSAKVLIDYYGVEGPEKYTTNSKKEFIITSEELEITKGKIDGVIKVGDKIWLGEFKSINLKGFSTLTGPKPEHLQQATLYLYVFNQMLSEGKYSHIKELNGYTKAEGIMFLYVCKDDTDMKQYNIPAYDRVFADLVNKIVEVRNHTEAKTLPPKTQDWCNSCPFAAKCKANFIPK